MKKNILLVLMVLVVLMPFRSLAEESTTTGIPSASVTQSVATVIQSANPWKTSYSSAFYSMSGTHQAQSDLYDFGAYTVALQVLNAQYQFEGGWAIVATGTYIEQDVDIYVGKRLIHDVVNGLGDTTLAIATPSVKMEDWVFSGNLGVNLPTGSIDNVSPGTAKKTDDAYFLQLGSGTVDPVANASAIYNTPAYQLGTHFSGIFRKSTNNNGYRLGDQYEASTWLEHPFASGFSGRLSGKYKVKEAIDGSDYTLSRSAYTEYYYHAQVDWNVNAAVRYLKKFNSSVSLLAELGVPLAEGMINNDNVVVSTLYYGTISLIGQF